MVYCRFYLTMILYSNIYALKQLRIDIQQSIWHLYKAVDIYIEVIGYILNKWFR